MVMTIGSAVISLGLVYNVVAGGNKAPAVAMPNQPSVSSDSNPQEQSSPMWGLSTSTVPPAYQVWVPSLMMMLLLTASVKTVKLVSAVNGLELE